MTFTISTAMLRLSGVDARVTVNINELPAQLRQRMVRHLRTGFLERGDAGTVLRMLFPDRVRSLPFSYGGGYAQIGASHSKSDCVTALLTAATLAGQSGYMNGVRCDGTAYVKCNKPLARRILDLSNDAEWQTEVAHYIERIERGDLVEVQLS